MNTMTPEQREEIERLLSEIEKQASPDRMPHASGAIWASALLPLAQFARQQLNLRVDGEKLREEAWRRWAIKFNPHDMPLIEALVLECLTTTPEEKE